MKKLSLAVGAAAVALVTATACGNSGNDRSAQNSASASLTAAATATAAHNQADVMFAQQMIPHHAQAIEMSDILLAKDGIDPRVRGLADRIKAAQGPEIERMQTWLSQWGQPTVPMGTTGMPMPGHDTSMMPGPGMPTPDGTPMQTTPTAAMPGGGGMNGMMSEQDMAALQNAEGVDASRLFLTQMITHHRGAIAMAQTEIDSGQNPEAVALARSIAESQQQEITTMENILASL